MGKKSKKRASETLVKSIMEDLQQDNNELSERSIKLNGSDSEEPSQHKTAMLISEGEVMPSGTRTIPEGLDSNVFKNPATAPTATASADDTSRSQSSEFSATRRIDDNEDSAPAKSDTYADRTQPMIRSSSPVNEVSTKVSHGYSRPMTKSSGQMPNSVTEAQMLQAENLKVAQTRILELEKEVEILRQENELLASAGEITKKRAEDLFAKVQEIERSKVETLDQAQMEMNIYRENLVEKDKDLQRMRMKIEDLETRLAKDLKKIRVRERELENRLELSKMEKTALVRAKDEALLDLKNKIDQLYAELEGYKHKCNELNLKVDGQHEQLGRTVRALRLALTHLEANDSNGTVTPLKKAE